MVDEVIQLDVNLLQPNPLQPRGTITAESLVDLVDSIKEHGILEPLVVAKTPAGFQIIAGERRWRAAKLAGFTHVPVIVRETSPKGMLEMALVENVQRVDLNALDRAKGFERLQTEFGLSVSEISVRIGKSVAYVSNSLRLLTLPDAIKDGLLSGLITEGHARALAAIEDPTQMIEAYKIILREAGSVRRAEELARRFKMKFFKENEETAAKPVQMKDPSDLEKIEHIEKSLAKFFSSDALDEGKKTSVKLTRTKRETRILLIFKGNLNETERRLEKFYNLFVNDGDSAKVV
ncbi:MAG: ParB/RepB/Spo0J family partition protein [Patescibacteria group bacterium]|nr:ParB/RepB/Spo0J family partition protein [Patescibacteria group bacterium]